MRRIFAFAIAAVLVCAASAQTNHIKRPTKKRPATTQVEPKKSKPKKAQQATKKATPKPKENIGPIVQAAPYTPNVLTLYANGVSFQMVEVRGGTFRMGATSEQGSDARSDEKPVHSVTLDSYYIGKTEVTQALWKAVMGKTVTQIASENNRNTHGVGLDYPMYYISWYDCQEFIQKLNALTGKNFRLPTEAEWEFACRGGNNSRGYKYSGSNDVNSVAWYDGNSSSQTHPVGTKASNELGIYDMSGNVWEWCADCFGDYSSNPQTNPTGSLSGSRRVGRGGGWRSGAWDCRSSGRSDSTPTDRYHNVGLRLAL